MAGNSGEGRVLGRAAWHIPTVTVLHKGSSRGSFRATGWHFRGAAPDLYGSRDGIRSA